MYTCITGVAHVPYTIPAYTGGDCSYPFMYVHNRSYPSIPNTIPACIPCEKTVKDTVGNQISIQNTGINI